MSNFDGVLFKVKHAAQCRAGRLVDSGPFRLFNGFLEGCPGLVVDRFGSAVVILDHAEPGHFDSLVDQIAQWAFNDLRGVTAVLWKQRQNPDADARNGRLIAGEALPSQVEENGIQYALDLTLNQDAGFYPDTRILRGWLADHMEGKHVLNCFAYTGSLGAAAGAGGAAQVVQTDLNGRFLALARLSWGLNNLPEDRHRLVVGDFFRVMGRMRHAGRLFDAVILDPPFFSTTDAGQVDLLTQTTRLINKVRPLVAHEGWLVVINNALFYSGAAFMAELDALCQSDYVAFSARIRVPEDIVGYPDTRQGALPVDPAPFNHATKIAVLRMVRKDKRRAGA